MASPAHELRQGLGSARAWGEAVGAPWYESLSETAPVVMFQPYETEHGPRHGNFNDASYAAVLADHHWAVRLSKAHPRRGAIPPDRRAKAREVDSCNSSDALLINVMCHPGVLVGVAKVLGVVGPPEFGVGGAVPVMTGSSLVADRSEIDLIFRGDRGSISLIVEAKLTERDFTTKRRCVVERYAEFNSVFDSDALHEVDREVSDYQLIRNLLAASYHSARFVLLYDDRRNDLLRRFETVLQAVRQRDLVERCRSVTWQEIANDCPPDLQEFLDLKYGIRG